MILRKPSKKPKKENQLDIIARNVAEMKGTMATKEDLKLVHERLDYTATKDDLRKTEERLSSQLETHDKVERGLIGDLQTRVKKLEQHVFKSP